MPLERLAPDALLLQTNLSGAVTALQDDPDASTGVWLTAPATQSAATRRFYLTDTAAGEGYALSESLPAANYFHNAGNLSGWRAGTGGTVPRYNYLVYNTEVVPGSFVTSEPDGAIVVSVGQGNFFRSPTPYKGSFASGNWTFALALRSSTRANTADYIIKYRVWRTTDPTGATGATQITSGAIASAMITATGSTTVDTNTSATWAAPAFSLNDEYLFVTCYIHVVTAAGNTNDDLNLRKGSTTSSILTTSFTPAEPNTEAQVSFPNPANAMSPGAGLQEFRALVRKKGTGTDPTAALHLREGGSLVSTLSGPTAINSAVGTVISGVWDATGRNAFQIEAGVVGVGQVGGSLEVGAIEWNATTEVMSVGSAFEDSAERETYPSDVSAPVVNTGVRVSFLTPVDQLVSGEVNQEFRVLVRKKGLGANPLVTVELYEDGVYRGTLFGPTAISSNSGTVLSVPWDPILATKLLGDAIEVAVVGTGVAGGTLEIGAIDWLTVGYPPQISNPYFESYHTVYGADIRGATQTIASSESISSGTGTFASQISLSFIQASFIGTLNAGEYPAGAYPPIENDNASVYGAALTWEDPASKVRIMPDSIVSVQGLTGPVVNVQDDPDAADDSWLTLG